MVRLAPPMTDSALDLDELPYLVGRAWTLADGARVEDLLAIAHADTDATGTALGRQRASGSQTPAPGDFIVAGLEFGGGDAAPATARALRTMGVGGVIARSFAAAFVRCALHVGLPPMQVEETEAIKMRDRLRVDIEGHKVVNLSSGDRYVIRNIYGEELDLLRAGGLAEYLAAKRSRG
jgi:3-isopropylmalate/(R)-2-methylmalate dehydratase small subunit